MSDYRKYERRKSLQQQVRLLLGLSLILVVVVIGYLLGGLINDWKADSIRLDITRTAIGLAQQTTIHLIYASETQEPYLTEISKIQVTQTYIADTSITLEAQIQPIVTPTSK